MNGDIYEGQLRPGDVALDEATARHLRELSSAARMDELRTKFREQGAIATTDAAGTTREMPRYRCHKKVWALKIAEVIPGKVKPTIAELKELLRDGQPEGLSLDPSGMLSGVGGATIVPGEEGYLPFHVDEEWCRKHNPLAGGYFVVYEDGYKSYSPAQAFESGYTRI